MTKNRISELCMLNIGDSFEVVGLEENFRKLILTNVTDSCSSVKGESSLDEDELVDGVKRKIWKNLGVAHVMSNRTPVRKL